MTPYPNHSRIILASASPRRHELLSSLGIEFTVQIPEIDETPLPDETPRSFVERMATEKAQTVSAESDTTVIAADTIVVNENTILGKPVDADHAFEMLAGLANKAHNVVTAVCLRRGNQSITFSVATEVIFRALKETEISAYIATGCPMDKAGAYAIQGGAAHMIRAINGSYTNVVGLPLCELHEALIASISF